MVGKPNQKLIFHKMPQLQIPILFMRNYIIAGVRVLGAIHQPIMVKSINLIH